MEERTGSRTGRGGRKGGDFRLVNPRAPVESGEAGQQARSLGPGVPQQGLLDRGDLRGTGSRHCSALFHVRLGLVLPYPASQPAVQLPQLYRPSNPTQASRKNVS